MQPTELLQDFRMVRLMREHFHVRISSVFILKSAHPAEKTYISVLFVYVTQLEPDVP